MWPFSKNMNPDDRIRELIVRSKFEDEVDVLFGVLQDNNFESILRRLYEVVDEVGEALEKSSGFGIQIKTDKAVAEWYLKMAMLISIRANNFDMVEHLSVGYAFLQGVDQSTASEKIARVRDLQANIKARLSGG